MNIKTFENLLETNPFFTTSDLYEDYDNDENEVIKQTQKDLELGDTNIQVNIFLFKNESAHLELNFDDFVSELDDYEKREALECFLLDYDIKNSLKSLFKDNTGFDFSHLNFEDTNIETPEEGIVEIGLSFK